MGLLYTYWTPNAGGAAHQVTGEVGGSNPALVDIGPPVMGHGMPPNVAWGQYAIDNASWHPIAGQGGSGVGVSPTYQRRRLTVTELQATFTQVA